MADRIQVNAEELATLTQQLLTFSGKLTNYASRLRGVHISQSSGGGISTGVSCRLNRVGMQVASSDVASALQRFAQGMDRLGDDATSLSRSVKRALALFEDLEHELQGIAELDDAGVWMPQGAQTSDDNMGLGMFVAATITAWLQRLFQGQAVKDWDLSPFVSGLMLALGGNVVESVNGPIYLWSEGKADLISWDHSSWKFSSSKIGKLKADMPELKVDWAQKKTVDTRSGRELTEKEAKNAVYRDKINVLEIGLASASWSGSVVHEAISNSVGDLTYDTSYDALYAEAHGKVQGGLYSYKIGEDGKTHRTLSPGLFAEAGASVSALETSIGLEYELIDNVSIGADVGTDFLSAEAKIGGGVGFVDGKFMLSGEASAEADLAKIEADAYVDIWGVKGIVGAEAKVGIGAHAKAGYRDGILDVDIGAALGVGGSVKFSVDVNGLISNVADSVDNIAKGINDFGKGVSKGVSAVWKLFS